MKRPTPVVICLLFCSVALAQEGIMMEGVGKETSASVLENIKPAATQKTFDIYSNKSASTNHFIPSGWMGDYGDLKLDDQNKENPHSAPTCIKWIYTGQARQGANWAGVFWQQPANNWGSKAGGFDLTGYKRLTFWARGTKGGEEIAEFKVGGITGEYGDSDSQAIGPITLTKAWKQYTIDLSDKDLRHVIGGFAWSASRDNNQDGFTIYLDDIRYEK